MRSLIVSILAAVFYIIAAWGYYTGKPWLFAMLSAIVFTLQEIHAEVYERNK